MILFKLSFKNSIDRPLRTALSILLLTLGIAMISFIIVLGDQLNNQFKNNIKSTDMVVGAKGSPLQLILSAIYHIDAPPGNIPIQETQKIVKHPLVKSVIPLAYGDYYKGNRIVGTTFLYPKVFNASLKEGVWWNSTFEVCIGSKVAELTGLKLGDHFAGMHGSKSDGHVHDDHHYTVVGILEPSNSVMDQLILCNVNSLWEAHNHDEHAHHDHEHHNHHTPSIKGSTDLPSEKELIKSTKAFMKSNSEKEITALLVKFRSPLAMVQLPRMVNERTNMQAALPAIEVSRMFDLLGLGMKLFQVIATVIIAVSGISLFISLYNALKERKFEMALMRAMGGSSKQLFLVTLLEGQYVVLTGWLLGIAISRIGLFLFSTYAQSEYYFTFESVYLLGDEYWLLLYCFLIGVVASVIPSFRILKLQIANVLSSGR